MAERRMPRGLLDPESEAIAEAYEASPAVRRQLRGLLDVVQRAFSLEPQEQTAGDTALDVVGGLVPGVSQAMALRDIERARRAGDPAGMAMAATEFVPFGRFAGMMRGPGPIMSELDVYHGTPHRFPATEANPLGEFDASKIGTGEGAQAYGHGVYLAEAPEVAEGYKKTISQSMTAGAQRRLQNAGGDLDKAIADTEARAAKYRQGGAKSYAEAAEEDLRGLRQFKEAGEWTSGSLYKADLPDEMIDRMLDWDKPLSEQPESVIKALTSGRAKLSPEMLAEIERRYGATPSGNRFGQGLQDFLMSEYSSIKTPADASEWLRKRGIPGIKYMDEGSRGYVVDLFYKGKPYSEHQGIKYPTLQSAQERIAEAQAEGFEPRLGTRGTRNFVVFPGEEKKVKILERK